MRLTPEGGACYQTLDSKSHAEMAAMLVQLSGPERRRLLAAMATIEALLGHAPAPAVPYVIRPPRPGDIGWVISRHGALYSEHYGWDETFEGFVAEIAGAFLNGHDPRRERCWIAERGGEIVGAVFLVKDNEDKEAAKLRMLYVEPSARGLGIGRHLVEECRLFARAAGYRRIRLWTNSILASARRIYEAAGYRLVRSEPHRSFGQDLVGETWELDL